MAIKEKVFGADHPSAASSLDNLAELYVSQGKYDQAEPLHRRALAIREKALGSNHPYLAQTLDAYADLLRKTNRATEASEMEARARAIRANLARRSGG